MWSLTLSIECTGKGQVLLVPPGLGTVPHSKQFSSSTNQSSQVEAFLVLILIPEIQKSETVYLKNIFPKIYKLSKQTKTTKTHKVLRNNYLF